MQQGSDHLCLVPRVRAVRGESEEVGSLHWEVETDKQLLRFVVRDSPMAYSRRLGARRGVVVDIHDTRYEIPDLSALDGRSRERLVQALCLRCAQPRVDNLASTSRREERASLARLARSSYAA